MSTLNSFLAIANVGKSRVRLVTPSKVAVVVKYLPPHNLESANDRQLAILLHIRTLAVVPVSIPAEGSDGENKVTYKVEAQSGIKAADILVKTAPAYVQEQYAAKIAVPVVTEPAVAMPEPEKTGKTRKTVPVS